MTKIAMVDQDFQNLMRFWSERAGEASGSFFWCQVDPFTARNAWWGLAVVEGEQHDTFQKRRADSAYPP